MYLLPVIGIYSDRNNNNKRTIYIIQWKEIRKKNKTFVVIKCHEKSKKKKTIRNRK